MNPYAIGAIAIAWAASVGGASFWFYGAGQDAEIASQAKIDKAIQQTRDAAQQGAANAIATAAAENTKTITKVRTITRDVPVYRDAQCQHDDRVFNDLNGALRGEPTGQSVVSQGSGSAQ